MRFNFGPIPEDERFDPVTEGWTSLREPPAAAVMLAAVPLGVVMAALMVWIWSLITPIFDVGLSGDGFSASITVPGLLVALLVLAGFVVIHELIHAVPVALAGSWDDLVIGFWPRHLAPYFATRGAVQRSVHLASGALPFLVMTLLPLLLAVGLSMNSVWLVLLSALNAAASGADLIMIALCSRQIPSTAMVRSQGYSTWWKMPAA